MNIKEIMQNRFACRTYKDEKLSDELVKSIIQTAILSPSSLDMQPWQIYAISSKDKLEKLSKICLNQSHVSTCSHALVIATHVDLRSNDKFFKDFIDAKDEKSRNWYLGFLNGRFDKMSDEQIYAYGSNQCYMLSANLVNIAFDAGVKSCIIGGFDRVACDEFLGLDNSIKSVLVITFGLSDEVAKQKHRRDINSVLEILK